MKPLSESSYISIGVVLWILGASFWAGALWNQVNANTLAISKLQIINEKLNKIDQRLSRIEGSIK